VGWLFDTFLRPGFQEAAAGRILLRAIKFPLRVEIPDEGLYFDTVADSNHKSGEAKSEVTK